MENDKSPQTIEDIRNGSDALPPRKERRRAGRHVETNAEQSTEEASREDPEKKETSETKLENVEEPEFVKKFEYRDHTADIQLHSWGDTLEEAFEQIVACMFNYIVELDYVAIDRGATRTIEVNSHSLDSLLYQFMDEALFQFTDFFIIKKVKIVAFDLDSFHIKAACFGEYFNREKHKDALGTEVKAITYNQMNIKVEEGRAECTVIVDI